MTHLVIIPCSRSASRRFGDAARTTLDAFRARVEGWIAPIADRLARIPSWSWPLIAAAAAWPSLAWTLRRFGDGSDDPFGIVAWIALGFVLLIARRRFDHPPRGRLLVGAAGIALFAALPIASMPDLPRALLATVAIVLALAAIVEDDEPFLPYAGFAFLALPLLSSLQFYAGYPLRVVTAEATRWLLIVFGSSVGRDGTALTVDGRLVLVDAPCSGIKMAWIGYFTACFAAWLFRASNRALIKRMPAVGLVILVGNVIRNTLLVALQVGDGPREQAIHEGIGLVTFTVVCVVIVAIFARCRDRVRALQRIRVESSGRFFAPTRVRSGPLLVVLVFVCATLLPLGTNHARPVATRASVEWPTRLDDEPLIPIALSAVEQRFAEDFPGSIARFTNGDRVVVLRDVESPTRRLHPAVDCYRALGYAVDGERLERREQDLLWRCFDARKDGAGLRVCERIVDRDGQAFTDVSSWYWSAVLGSSHGPWRTATIAMPDAGAAT